MQYLIGAGAILCAVGCASPYRAPGPHSGTTTISVAGIPGAPVSGHYVLGGYRVAFDETLPFRLSHVGLSDFEIYKVHPEETFALAAQYDVWGQHSESFSQARYGASGLRVRVHDGVIIDKITP